MRADDAPYWWDRPNDVLAVGDRVSRRQRDWNRDVELPEKFGHVVEVYHSSPCRGVVVDAWRLYAIRWDDGTVTLGHMREFITKRPPQQPPVFIPTAWLAPDRRRD